MEAVVAKTLNGVIGQGGQLPWHIPDDLRHFKERTINRSVVMGRRTWDEIYDRLGKPLPQRRNIVLTSRPLPPDIGGEVLSANTFDKAVSLAEGVPIIIGGAKLYQLALPQIKIIHLTEVLGDYQGDTFFPELNETEWHRHIEKETDEYRFVTLTRK